jgi:hypothetical protein
LWRKDCRFYFQEISKAHLSSSLWGREGALARLVPLGLAWNVMRWWGAAGQGKLAPSVGAVGVGVGDDELGDNNLELVLKLFVSSSISPEVLGI